MTMIAQQLAGELYRITETQPPVAGLFDLTPAMKPSVMDVMASILSGSWQLSSGVSVERDCPLLPDSHELSRGWHKFGFGEQRPTVVANIPLLRLRATIRKVSIRSDLQRCQVELDGWPDMTINLPGVDA